MHFKPFLLVAATVYLVMLPLLFAGSIITGGFLIAALPSVIQSCNFIIDVINKKMILPRNLMRLFDHVIDTQLSLTYNNFPRGVLNSYLPGYYGETWLGRSVRNIIRILSPLIRITKLVLCFFINIIPFVGPFLVILIKAPFSGFRKHKRYFHLKGFTNAQIYYVWMHQRQNYFYFGMISLLFESIPIIGYIFIFTNTVGAAFWAVDIEKNIYTQLLKERKGNDSIS
jgi:hypothetical protein